MKREIKCIIVEDDELDRLVLKQHLKGYKNIIVEGVFGSAEEAVSAISSETDVLILDIDLPGITGIELRKICKNVPACIFISSHPEYAIDTFELDTLDFISKPLKAARFDYAMQKLTDFFEMKEKSEGFDALIGENTVKIKDGNEIFQIRISDILYFEALKDYTRIITADKKHCILDSIGNLLQKEHFSNFVRIHRSFAIPKHHIRKKSAHEVEIVQQIKLPIGRAFKANLDFFNP
ncbi:LytR/AlgR family response regulator transcription factor [Chryseobacterium foetidum]|uniref:LytR/AlgR family response regulator transcription factor n=1 Tax=Chryseobacterium foetidum TaxID=2951057 RepID=UPI0021C6D15F|nr:LytTR family DNA-binding domain-containing protein [Chryseobacterium foetidum]